MCLKLVALSITCYCCYTNSIQKTFSTSAAFWLRFGLILFMAASIKFYAKWRINV